MAGPIRIELPMPFAMRTANAWLFPGGDPALVDCGLGTSKVYADLLDQIKTAEVVPESLRLFITHGHVDHAGNARKLRDDFGVQLHAPRVEAPFVETFRRDSIQRNDDYAAALHEHGMPQDMVAELRADSDAIDRFLEDCPIDHDVSGGETLVLGDLEATVIHTPGHTDGSISFHLTEDNHMLTGDTLLQHITSNAGELLERDHGSFHQYVQTIESLRRYVGVECLPGHLAPFTLTEEIVDTHLEHHRQRRDRIVAALDKPRTAWQLFATIFPDKNSGAHYFLGMAELVGHLHALEKDGEVVRGDRDGQRTFARAA